MSQEELAGQLSFEKRTPILVPTVGSLEGGAEKTKTSLKIFSAIIVENGDADFKHSTLAIIELSERKLSDIEFTTAIQSVDALSSTTKTLINPNTVILIDERDNES